MSRVGAPAPPTPGRAAPGPVGGPGWVEHLWAGGTTPWTAWLDRHGPAGALPRGALPGAQQLELLRRLNAAGRPSAALAERVLAAGGTGRGRLDLDLVGDGPGREHGAPPVDPSDLPEEDLLRIAVGLVADDVVSGDRAFPGRPASGTPRLGLPGRRRHRIAGDPWLAAHVRREAARRRRRLGGRPDLVLVIGTGLERMLADVWCARFAGPGAPPWDAWLGGWVERGGLPPRADPAALAEEWSRRQDPHRVHVVLDPAELPRLLRARRLAPPPDAPGAGAAELSRRVAAVLGVMVEPPERRRLVGDRLLPRLAALDVPGASHAPAVPAWAEPWLERRAGAVRDALRAGGYRVHGDPGTLLERTAGGPAGARPALAVAVAALLGAGLGAGPGAQAGEQPDGRIDGAGGRR